MFALMWLATYSSEKSRVSSAVHSPIDASTIIANVAYSPRMPLSMRSSRRSAPPANDTVIDHAAISSATHSDSSPIEDHARLAPPPCSPASACTSRVRRRVLVARRALGEQRRSRGTCRPRPCVPPTTTSTLSVNVSGAMPRYTTGNVFAPSVTLNAYCLPPGSRWIDAGNDARADLDADVHERRDRPASSPTARSASDSTTPVCLIDVAIR